MGNNVTIGLSPFCASSPDIHMYSLLPPSCVGFSIFPHQDRFDLVVKCALQLRHEYIHVPHIN